VDVVYDLLIISPAFASRGGVDTVPHMVGW